MSEEIERSLKLINQVCAAFVGNLAQHREIQEALLKIKKELETEVTDV